MSIEILEQTIAVAKELRLPGPVGPGLRKRLNEVRVKLLNWLSSMEQREPGEPRQIRGPTKRRRVKKHGKYEYEYYTPLIETGQILPGKLIRSETYEAVEKLVQFVSAHCLSIRVASRLGTDKQACADAIIELCQHLEPDQKNYKAFELHCRITKGTHRDKAIAWLKNHPDDKRTVGQVKKASERYPQKPD